MVRKGGCAWPAGRREPRHAKRRAYTRLAQASTVGSPKHESNADDRCRSNAQKNSGDAALLSAQSLPALESIEIPWGGFFPTGRGCFFALLLCWALSLSRIVAEGAACQCVDARKGEQAAKRGCARRR